MPRRWASSAKGRQGGPARGSARRGFLACEAVGAANFVVVRAEEVGVLRGGDEAGAEARGALDQGAGALPVGLYVGRRAELDGRDVEHAANLALEVAGVKGRGGLSSRGAGGLAVKGRGWAGGQGAPVGGRSGVRVGCDLIARQDSTDRQTLAT